MATFDFTASPSSVAMALVGNTGLFPSPLIQSAQTIDRGGAKWRATLQFDNMTGNRRGEVLAMIAQLRGQANRMRINVSDNPDRGVASGTPLVNGGGQTGNTLNIDGVGSVTNWIRAGDYFSVVVNGEHELKMATADINSSAGAATLQFEPPLRASPLNNAVINVGGNTPEGVFMLEGVVAGWTSAPHNSLSDISSATITLIEDVFATQ